MYTQGNLFNYGLLESSYCILCQNKVEDIIHMFVKFILFLQYHIENVMRNMLNEVINKMSFNKTCILVYEHVMKHELLFLE